MKRSSVSWTASLRVAALTALLASPAGAQFGPAQVRFRDAVKAFSGTLDIHGTASGTASGPAGAVATYTSDQHVSGTLKLDTYNPLTGAWVGTLDGTITVKETSTITFACTITNTYTASTTAQSDFLGQPLKFNLSFDIGSDTWSLWPSNNSVNGTAQSVQTCAGVSQTSSAPQPLRFAPTSMKMGFPFPAAGFDLVGTGTVACDGCGNANSNLVNYTFTYNLKATTSQPSITVATNPPGLAVTVDGTSFTAPQTFNWDPGSTHTIGTTSPQGTGTLRTFDSWSDGGSQTHTITTPNQDTTYTARFNVQYLLSAVVSPDSAGTIAADPCCTNGYFSNGTQVKVTAAPNCGFTFTNWSGDLTGTTNPQPVTMTSPKAVTANFTGSAANCASQKSQLSGPPPGSALGGSSATFSWGAVSGAAGYYLQLGTYPGGGNIFSGGTGLNVSQLVNNLPLSCSAIYARLGTLLGGVWQYADATYKCANGSAIAQMISPAPGSTLPSADTTFTWSSAAGASAYWLDIGSSAGGFDLSSQSAALATSQSVTGLPSDGRTLYARLWTAIGSQWQYNDYTYTAGSAPQKAGMLIPTPGTTLSGANVTFTWTAGSGASSYWLDVGSTLGGFDLFSQSAGQATSLAVANLPLNGGAVYVRLWTALGSSWAFNDYTYTAGAPSSAVMLTPPPGSGLSGPNVTFTWTAGTGASSYWLDVGSTAGGFDLFSQSAGQSTSLAAANLPANGAAVYVRLWTQLGSAWQYNDYTYKAAGVPEKARMTSPTP
ncbi:MAG: hypothetical protein JST11_16570, partial [Acidobacteria bacterium]|nr:hypothetical protein [Acidobacteriota bacterium]